MKGINSIKKRKEEVEPEIEYPCLMEGINSGSVYLMTSRNEGMRLWDGDNSPPINRVGKMTAIPNPDLLRYFEGSVTLSN